jgi:cytochrome P450
MSRPSLSALLDPSRRPDPYASYREWRTRSPIARLDGGLFVFSRYADCEAVLRDQRFGHAEPGDTLHRPPRVGDDVLVDEEGRPVRGFLSLNPPDHTRLRGLVAKAFTRRMVERLAPRIEQIATGLLDEAFGVDGPVDLISALAAPLPVAVISELLGVPPADRGRMAGWSAAVARGLDPPFLLPPGMAERVARARAEFAGYLRGLVALRRREPGDDLISALVAVHDGGEKLSENELIATCILLLIAGHETTVNLIGNGTLALLRDPEQLARLRAEPDLLERAVEEFLRYDSPVQLTARIALKAAEVAGVTVPPGSMVLLLIGAANRDPDVYEDPDRLDIGREPARHLAFGHGVHFCLGAPLARLEAQIVFRVLTRPDIRLEFAGEPRWKDQMLLRGLSELPVSLR